MDSSIHQHVIACKIQEDMRAATAARTAKDLARKPRREQRFARSRRFVRQSVNATVSHR